MVYIYNCDRKLYKVEEDGRTAPGVCGNSSVPLGHSGNVVTNWNTHSHTSLKQYTCTKI